MSDAKLQIPASAYGLGRLVSRFPRFWIKAGNFETKLLADELANIPVAAPIYICGLARAGSTILLEKLAGHPDVATHRYSDFPMVFTPYWWNRVLPAQNHKARERAHGDRLMITPQSPEAMEEMIWMAFFDKLHNPSQSNVLSGQTSNRAFEHFYREHIQKLLMVYAGKRYLAKGNYNLTRIGYIARLFPDARFIVPIRGPQSHIASLMRQHRRFCEAAAHDRRVADYMRMAGHFEFGPGRTPIHTGDGQAMEQVLAAWKSGKEAEGWAHYWDMVYRFAHSQLGPNVLVVRYEELCQNPQQTFKTIAAHCQLEFAPQAVSELARHIEAPSYYSANFAGEEKDAITRITAPASALFGY